MQKRWLVAGVAALAAIVITSVGWWSSAREPESARFGSCAVEDGVLTLTYEYGAADQPEVSIQKLDERVVVSLRMHHREGVSTMQVIFGTVTIRIPDRVTAVGYPDGQRLACQGLS